MRLPSLGVGNDDEELETEPEPEPEVARLMYTPVPWRPPIARIIWLNRESFLISFSSDLDIINIRSILGAIEEGGASH